MYNQSNFHTMFCVQMTQHMNMYSDGNGHTFGGRCTREINCGTNSGQFFDQILIGRRAFHRFVCSTIVTTLVVL